MNKEDLFTKISSTLPDGFTISENPNRIILPDCEIISNIAACTFLRTQEITALDGHVLQMRYIHGGCWINHLGVECTYLTEVKLGNLSDSGKYEEIIRAFHAFAKEYDFWVDWTNESNDSLHNPSSNYE